MTESESDPSAESFDDLRARAESGDADAQCTLGIMYEDGNGVPQDYAEAARWYQLAAGQGLASAQHALGVLYRDGHGVGQDPGQALFWYQLAVEQGFTLARFSLGFMCYNGRDMLSGEIRMLQAGVCIIPARRCAVSFPLNILKFPPAA